MTRPRPASVPVALLLAVLGSAAGWSAAPAPLRNAVPHLRVTRPTPVYALPLARSRVLFLLKPGQEVRILAGALQTGAALAAPAAPREGSGLYDPNLSTDVVDRVSEGYAIVFHELGGAGPAGAASDGPGAPAPSTVPVTPAGALAASDCGAPPTDGCAAPALREPDNSGAWIQILAPDGRTRGWVLLPAHRPAGTPPR